MKKLPLVHITFLDHCMGPMPGTTKAIQCDVVGWLLSEDKVGYRVVSWLCNGDPIEENSEGFYVVKHKGLRLRRLR